jgi:hypothetical protein
VIRVLILAGLAALAAGCSVDHRSGEFTCSRQQDCSGNRVCVGGWCVDPSAPDAAGPDAGGRADANQCPVPCTSCDPAAKQCTIDADQLPNSDSITCPTGWTCDILCTQENTCRDGIDCLAAAGCTITCSGDNACRDIECGPGPCEVACSGDDSCRGVDCSTSCACDVTCTGNQSCGDAILCPGFACDTGVGCTSFPPTCNDCPG